MNSEQECGKPQILASDFMEILEESNSLTNEFKFVQNVPKSNIMKDSFNGRIKVEPPPLSDYDDEGDELKYKQQIPEPIKDITKSRAQILSPTQAKVTSEKPSQRDNDSPKVKKLKRKKENIRPGALLPDDIWLNNHMTYSRMSAKEYKAHCKNLRKPCKKPVVCNAHTSLKNLSKISDDLKKVFAQGSEISKDWEQEKKCTRATMGTSILR